MLEVVVIGAGPAGLAVATELKRRGIAAVLVDKADKVGASWSSYYDNLRMHTERRTSYLPGYRIPRGYGRWPSRDDVARYLVEYARRHGLDVRLGTTIDGIDRCDGSWRLAGAELAARVVIVATGYSHTPYMPDWPGCGDFTGVLSHAAHYRNPTAFAGGDVLVVGAGNSGAEISADLVKGGAGRVRIAVRTVPALVRRQVSPLPNSAVTTVWRRLPVGVVGRLVALSARAVTPDLTARGLPRAPDKLFAQLQRDGVVPIVDVGFADLVRRGQIEIVSAVIGYDGDKVLLASGDPITPDTVIAATGYQRGLERLVGHLGVLDWQGRPLVNGPVTHPGAPDMYFLGLANPLSDSFRELRLSARTVARKIASN